MRIHHCDHDDPIECPLIMPMRNPLHVWRSWTRRHSKTMGDWSEFFKAQWLKLFAMKLRYKDSYWLPVDTEDRDDRLACIGRRLERRLASEWSPINVWEPSIMPGTQDWRYWRHPKQPPGMLLKDALAFFETLPFEQFGYEL